MVAGAGQRAALERAGRPPADADVRGGASASAAAGGVARAVCLHLEHPGRRGVAIHDARLPGLPHRGVPRMAAGHRLRPARGLDGSVTRRPAARSPSDRAVSGRSRHRHGVRGLARGAVVHRARSDRSRGRRNGHPRRARPGLPRRGLEPAHPGSRRDVPVRGAGGGPMGSAAATAGLRAQAAPWGTRRPLGVRHRGRAEPRPNRPRRAPAEHQGRHSRAASAGRAGSRRLESHRPARRARGSGQRGWCERAGLESRCRDCVPRVERHDCARPPRHGGTERSPFTVLPVR